MKKLLAVLSIMALSLAGAAVAGAAKVGKAKATSGVAYASVTHAEGKDLYVSGDFVDKALGHGGIVYVTNVNGTDQPGTYHVAAKRITIYTTKGSLTGKGSATQIFNQDGSVEVKDGKFALTKGTGKYKGKTFKGTFSGNQNSSGLYTFNYKAVLK